MALTDDLNYLNLAEIRAICERYKIPYRIAIETADRQRKKTRDTDRKGVILDRIRHFLATGEIPPETCFPATAVCFDPLPRKLTPDDRLHYGQYDKTNRALLRVLKELTGSQFENGAIARIVANRFWTLGVAPTLREFAAAWLEATREHTQPNAEWAYLSDRARKADVHDWKRIRAQKAAEVMRRLSAS